MIRTLVLVSVFGLVASERQSHAQPPAETPIASARREFEQAEAYFKAGTFDLAAARYQAAYELIHEPGLLFNIGLAWENHGDLAAAIANYDRYLEAAPSGVKVTEARARRAGLARKLEQRSAAEQAKLVEARRLEAERLEAERVEAQRREARRGATTAPRARPSLLPAGVALGVGAVSLGVAIVYGLRVRSLDDDLTHDLSTGAPPVDSGDGRFDDGARAALITDVALGISVVAIAVGGYLGYRALSAPTAGVVVAPAIGSGAAGATVEVHW